MAAAFDLIVTGGTVIDPGTGLDDRVDVGVSAGRIVAIEAGLPQHSASEVIDATGCYVSPGFIDLHAHVYWGVNFFAVDADPYCTANGVTSVVDCGSAGPVNFPGLRRYIVEKSRTRILAFVHIGQHGVQPMPTGELRNILYADPDGAARQAKLNSDIVVGIKVRMGETMVGDNGRQAMRMALEAAEMADMRLMVHIGGSPIPVEEIVDGMRRGDILTHCFTGLDPTIMDENGKVRTAVLRARDRGVLFDLAHAGRFMMDFNVARPAMAQGIRPHTLSTDAYTIRRPGAKDPGFNLPMVLTKFLALGWDLGEVIGACTSEPAKAIGWEDRIGRLEIGRDADITVFTVRDESVTLHDTEGNSMQGDRILEPVWTIRSGHPSPAKANPAFDGDSGRSLDTSYASTSA